MNAVVGMDAFIVASGPKPSRWSPYTVGEFVFSVAVGNRGAFFGYVREAERNGKNNMIYTVQHNDGSLWQRTASDLRKMSCGSRVAA